MTPRGFLIDLSVSNTISHFQQKTLREKSSKTYYKNNKTGLQLPPSNRAESLAPPIFCYKAVTYSGKTKNNKNNNN